MDFIFRFRLYNAQDMTYDLRDRRKYIHRSSRTDEITYNSRSHWHSLHGSMFSWFLSKLYCGVKSPRIVENSSYTCSIMQRPCSITSLLDLWWCPIFFSLKSPRHILQFAKQIIFLLFRYFSYLTRSPSCSFISFVANVYLKGVFKESRRPCENADIKL